MPTEINLDTQVSDAEFNTKVQETIQNNGPAKSALASFTEFDLVNGHNHDGVNSKKIEWIDINSKPTTFAPAPHDHNFHSNIGPDDHHSSLSAGLDIIPNSSTVTSYFKAPDGAKLYFGDTTRGAQLYLDEPNQRLILQNWGTDSLSFHIDSTVSTFILESTTIHLGTNSSTINFHRANLSGDNWSISGTGEATFSLVNGVSFSASSNNISGITRFNGVEIVGNGPFSGLTIGNSNYTINHNSHQQNTDTGTTNFSFTINSGAQAKITIITDNYTEPNSSEAALFNDTGSIKGLVIAGNKLRGDGRRKVRIYDDLEVEGNLFVLNGAITAGGLGVATYGQNGYIEDDSASGHIKIGNVVICWGISGGTAWRTVNLPITYESPPSISGGCADSSGADYRIRNITTTSFEIASVDDAGSFVNASISWIAVGRV